MVRTYNDVSLLVFSLRGLYSQLCYVKLIEDDRKRKSRRINKVIREAGVRRPITIPLVNEAILEPFIQAAKHIGTPIEPTLRSVGLPTQLTGRCTGPVIGKHRVRLHQCPIPLPVHFAQSSIRTWGTRTLKSSCLHMPWI